MRPGEHRPRQHLPSITEIPDFKALLQNSSPHRFPLAGISSSAASNGPGGGKKEPRMRWGRPDASASASPDVCVVRGSLHRRTAVQRSRAGVRVLLPSSPFPSYFLRHLPASGTVSSTVSHTVLPTDCYGKFPAIPRYRDTGIRLLTPFGQDERRLTRFLPDVYLNCWKGWPSDVHATSMNSPMLKHASQSSRSLCSFAVFGMPLVHGGSGSFPSNSAIMRSCKSSSHALPSSHVIKRVHINVEAFRNRCRLELPPQLRVIGRRGEHTCLEA